MGWKTVPLGQPCPTCGQVHEKCAAHVKATNPDRADRKGKPCRNKPVDGLEVCRLHGGSAPHALAAADRNVTRRRALGEVGALLDECGVMVAGRSHVDALDDALRRAGAMVVALGMLVGELDFDGTTTDGEAPRPRMIRPDHQGDPKPHVLVDLYGQWLDRYGRLAKVAADLGLEERRTQLDEVRAQAVVAAVLRGLQAAGADTPEVKTAIAAQLRALEPGGALPATG